MMEFLFHIWFWLLAALAVGVATGALLRRRPARPGPARWLFWTGLAFLAGALACALGALNGGADLYLESALATYAAFVIGATIGALGAGGSLREHEGWALGLIPAALVWWGAAHFAQPAFRAELQRKVVAAATRANVDGAGITLAGRDVNAPPAVAQNEALVKEIAALPGVRRVVAIAETPQQAAPAPKAPEPAQPAPPAQTPAGLDADVTPTRPMTLADPRAVLATLPVGPLDADNCQAALTAATILDRIEFRESSATITRRAALALDKAAALIRRCPDVTIEVGGHADSIGDDADNEELSQRRAEAVRRYLLREGVSGRRLVAVGYGATRPVVPNADADLRAMNRSVDFIVR